MKILVTGGAGRPRKGTSLALNPMKVLVTGGAGRLLSEPRSITL